MKKRLPAFVLMLAFFVSTAFAANTYKQNIQVEYGISLQFNNLPLQMTDVNGKSVQPFVYQGTTYVPIRAVSNAFGANIFYDSKNNAAYISNDFSEVCAVAHELSSILSEYYNIILLELNSVGTDNLKSDQASVSEVSSRVTSIYEAMSFLWGENGKNVNISIVVDEILPSFNASLLSLTKTSNAYAFYVQNPNDYHFDLFVDAIRVAINDYYVAKNSIDEFFTNYCLWRNLGF